MSFGSCDPEEPFNDTPFGSMYGVHKTYAMAMVLPGAVPVLLSQRGWLNATYVTAVYVLGLVLVPQSRYLGRYADWYYPRIFWNAVFQCVVTVCFLTFGGKATPYLGFVFGGVWLFACGDELRKFCIEHNIPLV